MENTEKNIEKIQLKLAQTNHIGDFITRLRNGYMARLKSIYIINKKYIRLLLEQLKVCGYIYDYVVKTNQNGFSFIEVTLRYSGKQIPAIRDIKVVSVPSKPVYVKSKDILAFTKEFCYNGFGTVFISSSIGIIPGHVARCKNLGGKVILTVF